MPPDDETRATGNVVAQPPVGGEAFMSVAEDSWGPHFLRFVGVVVVMQALSVIGTIWFVLALSRVGYRKRDVLLMVIPLYDVVLGTVAVWRYTAVSAYWTPRPDRTSAPLGRPSVTIIATVGWILILVGAAAFTRLR